MSTSPKADEIRTQAEALASALEIGAASVDDVVRWADAIIEREATPDASICELATCGRLHVPDVVHLLVDVPGVPDIEESRRLVLQMLLDSLAKGQRRADQVARSLYDLETVAEIADPELAELARWAWDALETADSDRDAIVERMRACLTRCAKHGEDLQTLAHSEKSGD